MKLFGILHATDGSLSVRTSKLLKVSIGLGKGRDVHAHIAPTGKWMLALGGKVTPYDTREACEDAYKKGVGAAPERKMPKKLPYFTFTQPGPDGFHEPNFDAIEAHGPTPKQIDVVLFGKLDDIFKPAMQMWGKRDLQCYGDGMTGHRLIQLAKTPEEKALIVPGERYFTVSKCFTGGCSFAKGDAPLCKPHAEFFFQLRNYPLVGGSAGYSGTSYVGIKALGGVLESALGDGTVAAGLVMTMGIKQYTPAAGRGAAWHVTLRSTGEIARNVAPTVVPETQEQPEAE